VDKILTHTKAPFELVVAEDGGNDGSREWCLSAGIGLVSGNNRGVSWNKNRGLYYLAALNCDPILVIEDDCFPIEDTWVEGWIAGTQLWGHLSVAHPKLSAWNIGGDGSPLEPYVNMKATAQCTSISSYLLKTVGYLDTRFVGYGVGHAEWTTRIKSSGFGYRVVELDSGVKAKANLYINGLMGFEDSITFKDRKSIKRNEDLFSEIKKEPGWNKSPRMPWSTDEEAQIFIQELLDSGIGIVPTIVAENSHIDVRKLPIIKSPEKRQAVINLIEGFENQLKDESYRKVLINLFDSPSGFMFKRGFLHSVVHHSIVVDGEISATPWFNYAIIDILDQRVGIDMSVFEYGAGYSTLWWQTRVKFVASVDHSKNWVSILRKQIMPNVDLTFAKLEYGGDYSKTILKYHCLFDVIVVDGRDRVNCAKNSIQRLSPSGVIIFDNSQRSYYREEILNLLTLGFRELQISGLAPMTHLESYTSILYRDGNCLGI